MMNNFQAWRVVESNQQNEKSELKWCDVDSKPLNESDVRIEVHYSSVNYKDALASKAHPGIVRSFPITPGIDAAGEVIESNSKLYSVGQKVIVTGYELGVSHDGGWSQQIVVPEAWVVPLPNGMSLARAMMWGTAGFTAGQSVASLQQHNVDPADGEILVTGATGGVGSLAVRILSKIGYEVVASTGKKSSGPQLLDWGAKRVIDRKETLNSADRPLAKACWAGVIDTVGGEILASAIRATSHRGCVTACGLTAGSDLPLTVYPFLLRGVTLSGIDSAACPMQSRLRIWEKLSGPWQIENLGDQSVISDLSQAPNIADKLLAGQAIGRNVLQCKK